MSKSTYRKKAVKMCLENEFRDKGWFYPEQLHDRINLGMKRDKNADRGRGAHQYLPNTHSFITRRSVSNHCKTLFLKGFLKRRFMTGRQLYLYRCGKLPESLMWEPQSG